MKRRALLQSGALALPSLAMAQTGLAGAGPVTAGLIHLSALLSGEAERHA